jgi:Lhr-like helicase
MTTSFEVRAELEDRLERDLLGPWDGPEEELPPKTSPAERYLLGRLVPRPSREAPQGIETEDPSEAVDAEERDPSLVDREVTATSDDAGEDEPESDTTVRSGSMAASAIGLAFSVATNVDVISVDARWGRYERAPSEIHETPTGRPTTTWHRVPAGGPVEIRLDAEDSGYEVPDGEQEGVTVHYTVRHRGPRRVVELALVNGQAMAAKTPDVARLYQVGLTVTALDGNAPVFLGHNDPELGEPITGNDDEKLHLALLNRERRQYAHGRQCAVDAFVRDGEYRAWKLATTCFPSAEVSLVVPGKVPGLVLDMARLGSPELGGEELVRALRPLVTGYRRWLDGQEERLADPEVARYGTAGPMALARARDVSERLERAIDMLRDNAVAREAFRFANQAMALQRVRSEVVRGRLAADDADVSSLLREHDVPKNRSWRPFQLAFVLLCLPGLTDPSHPDAHRGAIDPDDAQVQLLFFPTGGGKTEAYLGLAAYTFAIRRLQGVVGTGADARDGTRGVAVLMRYTLRLLTAQQFQRASALICACEWLRRERLAAGDSRWGTTPFRIGLWVGKSVTPNDFDDAERQITESRGYERSIGGPLQLAVCPWCGSRLSGSQDLTTNRLRRRVLLYCSDPEGDCPFTERRSPGEGLPVLTVDEEIYRLTPSLVIATVDKLAQLPWKAATATLFGLVETECTRHGWQNPDFAVFCRTGHRASGDLPPAEVRPVIRLRPPDLIIQDELHLINDALGSMVGLYETVIDRLCSRPRDGQQVRPVLVASTATVRRAADQAEQVFARRLVVFPPPVLDAGDTFFSAVVAPSAETPGRRYRGVLAPGERLKSVEIRVVSALLEHAQFLFDRDGVAADPYMTVVDYFTSTRELAGMRRLVEDDITDRLRSLQVRTRRRTPRVDELTGRMPSSKIAETLAELERPFDPSFESTAAMDAFRSDPAAARERVAELRPVQPVDVLLATSMLQVGVDVQRLGLMVVTGQPKNTAEYIQATSRVGRSVHRPGLVVTIYQWSRPRDLAHYESFGYDHATFGLRVEGVTTTPFSDRALDRGLTGVLVTSLRHSGMAGLPNSAAAGVPLSGSLVDELIGAIQQRAARVTHDQARAEQVGSELRHRLDKWYLRRETLQTGTLGFKPGNDIAGLLRQPDEGTWDLWSVPLSLREVEAEIILQLDRDDRSVSEAPPWSYERPAKSAGGGS